MHPEEEQRPQAEGTQLASPELDRLVQKLQEAANMLQICLAKARPTVIKREGNPFFRLLAEQHYRTAMTLVQALLRLPEVIYRDEGAVLALEGVVAAGKPPQPLGVEGFLRVCREAAGASAAPGNPIPYEEDLRKDLQPLVDELFSERSLREGGRPCPRYEALLATFVAIPAVVEEPLPPPAAPPAPTPPAPQPEPPGVLYEKVFPYEGAANPPRRAMGEMCLKFLRYTQGVSEEEALRLINADTLRNFEGYILKALGDYHGDVRFQISRKPGGDLDVKLERIPASACA